MPTQRRHRDHTPIMTAVLALLISMLMAMPVAAADNDTGNTEREPASTTRQESEPKCVHGCQRWGKVCNVDPRGVYKCRRTCEKFGEICE